VACWPFGRDVGGGEAPEEGLIADYFIASEGFSCNDGPWPLDWYAESWQTYCSKLDQRAWVMTPQCDNVTWKSGYSSLDEVENVTLSKCSQKSGLTCVIFDRNGEKCEKPTPWPPAPSVVHWMPPFKGTFPVIQGPNECAPTHCHGTFNEDAVDISMPKGTEVIAGRSGVVVRIKDGHGDGAPCTNGRNYEANLIGIRADDGTEDEYYHLLAGSIRVRWGERVDVGQLLALSGNSGCSGGPHLHVQTVNPNHINTVDMAFTIPCSHLESVEAVHFQVWCNDANCSCVSTFCDPKTWSGDKLKDWKEYCDGPNDKAWVSDSACDYYGYQTGMPNAVAMAKEACGGQHCHVKDENGHQCD